MICNDKLYKFLRQNVPTGPDEFIVDIVVVSKDTSPKKMGDDSFVVKGKLKIIT